MKNKFPSDSEVDIGKIFRTIMMQSKIIISITMIGIILGISLYIFTTPTYKVKSLLQVFASQTNSLSSNGTFDLLLGNNIDYDLENLETLYISRSNILDIIKNQNLNLRFEDKKYIDFDFIKHFEDKNPNSEYKNNYKFIPLIDSYNLYENDNLLGNFSYDIQYVEKNIEFNFIKNPELFNEEVNFVYEKPEDLYFEIKNKFEVVSFISSRNYYRRNNGLIEISFSSRNVEKGRSVLDYANNLFLNKNILTESEQARKAIDYIDLSIKNAEETLSENRIKLRKFQEVNTTVNVDLEIGAIIDSLNKIEENININDLEIVKASKNYTDTNPLYLELLNKRETLLDQKKSIESKIKALPDAQQEYVNLFRNLEFSQQVFSELQSKRLEFSIKEASTLGNIRIIDKAYFDSQITPTLLSSIFIIFGFFLFSVIFTVIRGIYFLPITNPAEIQDNGIEIKILGVIPKVNFEDNSNSHKEKLTQSIESIVVNIKNKIDSLERTKENGFSILVSSPSPSNGKSFVTKLLAEKFSKIGISTVMIDADFKRGDLHENYKNLNKIKSKDFFNLDEKNIENYKVEDNLYLIPRVSDLRSSFGLINTYEFEKAISFLKNNFEILIYDTAPMLSVSDTSQLMTSADMRLLITRHSVTKVNEVKQMVSLADQIGIEFDGVVYNSYEKPSSYYGYYSLYGYYDYQYYANKYLYESYEYENEDK